MKLSAKASYTINIIDYAAKNRDKFFSLSDVVKNYPKNCPTDKDKQAFLSIILRELKTGGILVSQKGPNGGYKLASEPSEISFKDVFKAIGETTLSYQLELFKSDICNLFGTELHKHLDIFFDRKVADFVKVECQSN